MVNDREPAGADRPVAVEEPAEDVPAEAPASRRVHAERAFPWGLAAVLTCLYAVYSLWRDALMLTGGFDLGIFDQAVHAYARFQAPVTPLKGPGFDLLGDHFHPIIALLVPFYWIWPSARMLLVAQAALVGFSVVPVTRLAIRRLGLWAGAAIGVAYGLSWGVQDAIGFDFHEVAFAAPLLALSMVALAERRWRAAAAWALPLLLVKEDLPLTVAAIGCYLFFQHQRRLGAAVAVIGAGAFPLLTMVVIPTLNPHHVYRYWFYVSGDGVVGPPPSLGRLFHIAVTLPQTMVDNQSKIWLVIALIGLTAFAGLRSPIILIAAPSLVLRLGTSQPSYWTTDNYQYNLQLMPIVFVALVDALSRLHGTRLAALRGSARVVPVAVLAICVVILPKYAFWNLLHYHSAGTHVGAARALAAEIPSGVDVMATNLLVPLIVDRDTVYLFPNTADIPAEYVFVDTTDSVTPTGLVDMTAKAAVLPSDGYRLVTSRDGLELYRSSG